MSCSASISKEQSEAIDKMIRYQEIIEALKEACDICGDVSLTDAIETMRRKTYYNEPSDSLSQWSKLNECIDALISKEKISYETA